MRAKLLQLCPTLCNPMDCRPSPRILCPWDSPGKNAGAIPFSRGSSRPRDWTWVSCIAGRFFIVWDSGEAPEPWSPQLINEDDDHIGHTGLLQDNTCANHLMNTMNECHSFFPFFIFFFQLEMFYAYQFTISFPSHLNSILISFECFFPLVCAYSSGVNLV